MQTLGIVNCCGREDEYYQQFKKERKWQYYKMDQMEDFEVR